MKERLGGLGVLAGAAVVLIGAAMYTVLSPLQLRILNYPHLRPVLIANVMVPTLFGLFGLWMVIEKSMMPAVGALALSLFNILVGVVPKLLPTDTSPPQYSDVWWTTPLPDFLVPTLLVILIGYLMVAGAVSFQLLQLRGTRVPLPMILPGLLISFGGPVLQLGLGSLAVAIGYPPAPGLYLTTGIWFTLVGLALILIAGISRAFLNRRSDRSASPLPS